MTDLRQLRIGCMFTYLAQVPTAAVFMVRPAASAAVAMEGGRWLTDPSVPVHDYTDIYGNECARMVLPAGRSRFGFSAVAVVPDATEDADPDGAGMPPAALPDDALIYTLPSRYCLPDLLADEAWQRFGGLAPGYQRVQAICDHVHEHVTFQYGSTTATSTAADVNAIRPRRVPRLHPPRDLVLPGAEHPRPLHVRLPARHGRPRDPAPMDFAAWMEVWLGDRWWTFDPRNNARRKGRVLIARGRDAADVAVATTFGGPVLESMTVESAEIPD